MRIHGYLCNKKNPQLKKNQKKKSSHKKKTQKKNAAKKERLSNIDYLEFMSDEQIKKLETSRCTKLLTGKRQRKVLKRMRQAAREKNDEVKFNEKPKKEAKESTSQNDSDVEMKET